MTPMRIQATAAHASRHAPQDDVCAHEFSPVADRSGSEIARRCGRCLLIQHPTKCEQCGGVFWLGTEAPALRKIDGKVLVLCGEKCIKAARKVKRDEKAAKRRALQVKTHKLHKTDDSKTACGRKVKPLKGPEAKTSERSRDITCSRCQDVA